MKTELPAFKRCCFCLPLRRGLVAWGYIRLALDALALARFIYIFVQMCYHPYLVEMLLVSATIMYYFIDLLFAIFLIVGGHRKSHKLLRVSYIYCIVWLALILVMGGLIIYTDYAWLMRKVDINLYNFKNIVVDSAIPFLLIFIQVYLILLLRSEEIKLRKESQGMKFVNNAAEAEAQCVYTNSLNVG